MCGLWQQAGCGDCLAQRVSSLTALFFSGPNIDVSYTCFYLSSKIIDDRSMRSTEEQPNVDGITVNTRSKLKIVVSHQDHLKPITCEAANVAMRTPINKSTEISVLCKLTVLLVLLFFRFFQKMALAFFAFFLNSWTSFVLI